MRSKGKIFIIMILILMTGCTKTTQNMAQTQVIEVVSKEKLEPKIEQIDISVTGDIMFHSTQLKAAYNKELNTYEFDSVFEKVKPYFENADLAIANFETVTAGEDARYSGYPSFNTPENILDTLKNLGIDVLTTANNHCLDRRKEGLIKTIDEMDKREIEHLGTYKEQNIESFIKDVKGIKIGIISYTYGCNGMENTLTNEELGYMVNIIDENKILKDVEQLKSRGADYILSFMHWGNEYNRNASENQKELADKMLAMGVDAILGSHPHVIQESEIKTIDAKEKFVIYSMGNFVSNQRRETLDGGYAKYTEDGIIVNLSIEKNFETNETKLKNVNYTPTWVNRYLDMGKYKYEIIPIELNEVDKYPKIKEKLIDSYNQTKVQMFDYKNDYEK